VGDDSSFADFMRGNAARLFRLAYLLTGDRHRAEELTQDALARTYQAWQRVLDDDAYAYTRRILVNLHTDWWRARRWREQAVAEPPDATGAPDPAVSVSQRDWAVRTLLRLSRRERAVVVLRYYADMSESDIARELGISPGTVKSTAARALEKLRDHAGQTALEDVS
jgi:RNA polymerase sigma-70 factor (sigma-E family)